MLTNIKFIILAILIVATLLVGVSSLSLGAALTLITIVYTSVVFFNN